VPKSRRRTRQASQELDATLEAKGQCSNFGAEQEFAESVVPGNAVGVRDASKDAPLFRTALRKTGQLTKNSLNGVDVGKMMKRRLRNASLPSRLSPHSFRVTTITDLLEQGAPLEDEQRLAGHADPRTTRLYDRRQKKITRNIVERISI
jgi:integrase/recombinase XerD